MLDFYLIAAHQALPANPGEAGLVVAGRMESEVFNRLKRIRIIDERFEYDTDFRWSRAVMAQMRSTIAQYQFQSSTDVQQLLCLLDLADQNNSSLIAYAD